MFIDAQNLDNGTRLEAEVCIVGAGAAGITLALQLADAGKDVLLLESGGFQYEQPTQKLYGGRSHGAVLDSSEKYLTRSRLRRFGGSTNHWNGWCAPLDSDDFEKLTWSEHKGWPISREDLDPYYRRAAPYLDIVPGYNDIPGFMAEDSAFEPFYFSLSRPTRFAIKYRQPLNQNPRIRVVLHANVMKLAANESGAVDSVTASTLEGVRLSVTARRYVLACGGIENTRILMAVREAEDGIRVHSDALGRFFMEHPIARVGHLVLAHGRKTRMADFDRYLAADGTRVRRGVFRPRAEIRKEKAWQNAVVVLEREDSWDAGEYAEAVAAAGIAGARLGKTPGKVENGSYFAKISFATEQTPDRESRLELYPARDAMGMQRVRLHWRILDRDAVAMREMVEHFQRRIGVALEGRMHNSVDDLAPWERASGSNHHMGTTRMAESAADGVVDSNSRVFGVDNLYIAGSSVFSTSGAVNPTFTIVALAVRLADHLGTQV